MRTRSLWLVPFLALAACGSNHPLAGNWAQQLDGGKKGLNLEFQTGGDKVMVHTAPRDDGSHDHLHGTYTFDAATMAITVKCKLLGDGKADTWAGTLAGKALELSSADGKLAFAQGGSAH
jgi:hypothetical protein